MKSIEKLTQEVFSNPTAPYREGWVLTYIKSELKRLKVPFFEDKWGNIIAGTVNRLELRKSKKVAMVAHTDHPGFHLIKKMKKNIWLAKWYGGCPPKIRGAPVSIHSPARPEVISRGKILSPTLLKNKTLKIHINAKRNLRDSLDENSFGAFDFPGFAKRRTRIKTRVADDLTGVVIILATFERLKAKERKHMAGIFTRAEETGFRGALGVIYQNLLGPGISVISLEASRALEGARIGKGPVIRLGDKRSLFDSVLTSQLDLAAALLKKENKKFNFQRRIMNGGTCEATAFNFHNVPAGGLAIPLGNYHNQRPDGKPGPEFIDLKDLEGGVSICVRFFKNQSKNLSPVGDFVKTLKKEFQRDRPLLNQKIHYGERRAHV